MSDFRLKDPFVYTSNKKRPSENLWATDPSEILLHATVSRPRGPVPDMGYWPWYSRIAPEHRYQYLEWLASGRSALPLNDGLLFLYFYGLERRLLVDGLDKAWVLREVVRLRGLDEPRRGTSEGRSFRDYSAGLLWFEVARAPEMFDERAFTKVCELTDRWNETTVPVPLCWLQHHGRPLPPSLAMHLARVLPDSMQSVVTKRVGDRFGELFKKRYAETFGPGMSLQAPKRIRRHHYRPASGGLREFSCPIADPCSLPSQFKPLSSLWNSCIQDLRQLSKVAVPVNAVLTPEAWEAMPPDLREGVDHPLADQLQSLVSGAQTEPTEDGVSLITIDRLAAVLGMPTRARLTASQSRRLADVLSFSGYAVEPDARRDGRPYSWDATVALLVQGDDPQPEVGRYEGAASILRLGLVVAGADGVVDPEELRHLGEHIDTVFDLPPHEQRRLNALRTVLLKTGADAAAVAKRLETSLTVTMRRGVGRLLVAVAAESGAIDRQELAALRKCFRLLGLGPELLDEALGEITGGETVGTVAVQTAEPGGPGEAIPQPSSGLRLNREAISAIMAETRDVAKLLSEAMLVDEPTPAPTPTPIPAPIPAHTPTPHPQPHTPAAIQTPQATSRPPESQTDPLQDARGYPGLPARYSSFLSELGTRPIWSRAEVEALARRHGHMLSGAVEAINEWSFETRGAPLLDESEEVLTVDQSLL